MGSFIELLIWRLRRFPEEAPLTMLGPLKAVGVSPARSSCPHSIPPQVPLLWREVTSCAAAHPQLFLAC